MPKFMPEGITWLYNLCNESWNPIFDYMKSSILRLTYTIYNFVIIFTNSLVVILSPQVCAEYDAQIRSERHVTEGEEQSTILDPIYVRTLHVPQQCNALFPCRIFELYCSFVFTSY